MQNLAGAALTSHDCPRCITKDELLKRQAALIERLQAALTAYVRVDERQTRGSHGPVTARMREQARALVKKAWL